MIDKLYDEFISSVRKNNRYVYDDGDEEEFDKDELAHHLQLYESNKHLDKK
jgi:hypothetical protein